MAALSNEVQSGAKGDGSRATRVVFVVASALVFAVFSAVTLYERAPLRHTLRVIAPDEVAPGAPVPIVARLFAHDGVSLVRELDEAQVAFEVRRGAETVLTGELVRAGRPHFGAEVSAPKREGRYELIVRYGSTVARRALDVVAQPPLAALIPLPPEMRVVSTKRDGRELAAEVRVSSGACVPELRCEIAVVHEPVFTDLRLDGLSGVRVSNEVERSAVVSSWTAVVRALEARVSVTGARGGGQATVESSLPVASGGVAVRGARRLVPNGGSITLEIESLGDGPHLYTHHLDGTLWAVGGAVERVRLEGLRPGIHRVQVGGDLFSPTSLAKAGAFVFVVHSNERSVDALLERAASRVLEALELPDPFGPTLLREPDELAARAILARLEAHRAQPPRAITGEDRGFEERRERVAGLRLFGAATILVLGGWVVAVSLRSSRRAARAAREHAAREGVTEWVRPARGAAIRLGVALFLGYLLAAAVLLSRFWIFG
jgi:hypothetical protein